MISVSRSLRWSRSEPALRPTTSVGPGHRDLTVDRSTVRRAAPLTDALFISLSLRAQRFRRSGVFRRTPGVLISAQATMHFRPAPVKDPPPSPLEEDRSSPSAEHHHNRQGGCWEPVNEAPLWPPRPSVRSRKDCV